MLILRTIIKHSYCCFLPDEEYETFVLMMINGRISPSYKDVTSVLVNYGFRRMDKVSSENVSGDVMMVRAGNLSQQENSENLKERPNLGSSSLKKTNT